MKIVLIGFSGTGKSEVGKILSQRLGLKFLDTDAFIEAKENRSIAEIFARCGEGYFRQLEKELVASLADADNLVISTGGGVVMDKENVKNLKKNGILIYLIATKEAIYERIKNDDSRPLLSGKNMMEKIESLLRRRSMDYLQTNNIVDVTCLSFDQVADRIIKIINGEIKMTIVGLVGSATETSLSPLIHNASFNYLGLDFYYLRLETEDLAELVERAKNLGLGGFNVTMPYKIEIIKFLDQLDDVAKSVGAVNTVVNREGRLIGYNTDVLGALSHLHQHLQTAGLKPEQYLPGKLAVIIGAGGAARAIAFCLKREKCRVIIVNRTLSRAKSLAEEFKLEYASFADLRELQPQILVNTTPLGSADLIHLSPIDPSILQPKMIVWELVYNPVRTKLLQEAEKRGCLTVDGLGMLVHQGAASFELWTGKKAPVHLMFEVAKKYLGLI